MPVYKITGPDGANYEVNAPDGASESDVLAYAQRNFKMAAAPKPSKPFGQALDEGLRDIPRQAGLTARSALNGIGGFADFVTSPLRAGMNSLLAGSQERANMIADKIAPDQRREPMQIQSGSGQALADLLGLPQPQNGTERLVGNGVEFMAGGAGLLALGRSMARGAPSVAQRVGESLAASPAQQLMSAGAAGLAGGYTRETGGGPGAQLVAQLAAGIGTPFAAQVAQRGGRALASSLRPAEIPPIQIDMTINNALTGMPSAGGQGSTMTLASLPADVAADLRKDVAAAMQISGNLSPDAIRRLADYRLTGLTPNRAGLTLTPADVTRQRNLAKQSANSSDPAAQSLANMENSNNDLLTQGLNRLGANTPDDKIAGAGRIMSGLESTNNRATTAIDKRYADARDTQGRSVALDPNAFANRAGDLLHEANIESFLTPDIRNKLNSFASGQTPLNVEIAEQFKTNIGNIQRGSQDGNTRKALGLVRQALDEAPLLADQQIGQESIKAFNSARTLNRRWMNIVEKTPALQAIRDGVEPDKFVQDFVIGNGKGASVMSAAQLKNNISNTPDALQAVKEQIVSYLKNQGKSGAADELVNFSQSGYNKALANIGDRKLALFFPGDELAQLKAIGRVASYEQVQPKGAAVNNSNTAAALLDRLLPVLGKIPFGQQAVGTPLQNMMLSSQVSGTLSAPRSLVAGPVAVPGMQASPRMQPTPSPAIFMPASDQLGDDERKRRLAQLLGYAQ